MKEKLKAILDKYSINTTIKELNDFEIFNNELIEYNKIHNITNITEEDDVLYKHYLDSVLPYDLFQNNSKVLDIGCGGGFPSIPLKIINNTLKFTAIDSVNKKTEFVKSISNKLNMNDFNVIHTRIEDIAKKKEFREQYDYVISRAVAPLNIILEYSAPMTRNNGLIVCYKGSKYQEEIDNAKNALKVLNCEIVDIKEYYIEEIDAYRYIILIKKKDTINIKYPRGQNKPRLQPL